MFPSLIQVNVPSAVLSIHKLPFQGAVGTPPGPWCPRPPHVNFPALLPHCPPMPPASLFHTPGTRKDPDLVLQLGDGRSGAHGTQHVSDSTLGSEGTRAWMPTMTSAQPHDTGPTVSGTSDRRSCEQLGSHPGETATQRRSHQPGNSIQCSAISFPAWGLNHC